MYRVDRSSGFDQLNFDPPVRKPGDEPQPRNSDQATCDHQPLRSARVTC